MTVGGGTPERVPPFTKHPGFGWHVHVHVSERLKRPPSDENENQLGGQWPASCPLWSRTKYWTCAPTRRLPHRRVPLLAANDRGIIDTRMPRRPYANGYGKR